MKAAADPYFKILVRWINRGSIDDPGKDFFVEDHEIVGLSKLPLEYSDDYWEKRYTIKADQVQQWFLISSMPYSGGLLVFGLTVFYSNCHPASHMIVAEKSQLLQFDHGQFDKERLINHLLTSL